MSRRIHPIAGYSISAIAHLGLFAWAWALPVRAQKSEHVDVQIVETVKPVEPKPPAPEPPKPAAPIKMRPARRVAMIPPPPSNTPPPETPPPPDTPLTTNPAPTPGPVHLGISLSSTSAGGGFAAPVGNSLAGRPGARAAAGPADDDIGPVARMAALTEQPEPIDTSIPQAEYPKDALDSGFEGSVTLKIVIDANGRVRKATVIKDPGHGLGAAAVKSALHHFKFKPGQVNGKVTATEWTFTVTYELP